MAEIVDLTADSPPDAPQPADDSAVVARLELFTGASADAARAALRAHGNDADAAASALLAAIPDTPATNDDLAAIRRLRDEENSQQPSVKEMKAAIAAAGLATADLLERADVEARYAEALAPAASDADLAAIRRLRDEQNGSMAQQLAEARRQRAAHHASRPPPAVTGELKVATYNVWSSVETRILRSRRWRRRDVLYAQVGMLELFDESVAPHYMMGRKPGMFPSFSDAYAEGEGYPHPVPFDLFDPFGSLRKMMDTEEKRARGRLVEINNGRAAMLGIFGFMSASKVPGSVPVLTFIPPYDGNYMIPFEGNFHMPSMM